MEGASIVLHKLIVPCWGEIWNCIFLKQNVVSSGRTNRDRNKSYHEMKKNFVFVRLIEGLF